MTAEVVTSARPITTSERSQASQNLGATMTDDLQARKPDSEGRCSSDASSLIHTAVETMHVMESVVLVEEGVAVSAEGSARYTELLVNYEVDADDAESVWWKALSAVGRFLSESTGGLIKRPGDSTGFVSSAIDDDLDAKSLEQVVVHCDDVYAARPAFVSTNDSRARSISFSGGGNLWTYYLGAGHRLFTDYDLDDVRFLAASAGLFSAVPLAMGIDPYEWCRADWGKCLDYFRTRFGFYSAFAGSQSFYRDLWENFLPPDAHIRATNKLGISITMVPSFKNKVVWEYRTRTELIDCIVASICLPILFIREGVIDTENHGLAFDGVFTNGQPIFDEHTVKVRTITPLFYNVFGNRSPKERWDEQMTGEKQAAHVTILASSSSHMLRVPSWEDVWTTALTGEEAIRQSSEVLDRRGWIRKETVKEVALSQ